HRLRSPITLAQKYLPVGLAVGIKATVFAPFPVGHPKARILPRLREIFQLREHPLMRYDCRAAFFGVIDTQNKTIDLKYASFAGKHVEASGPLTGLNSLLESALLEQILDHRGGWMTGNLEFN